MCLCERILDPQKWVQKTTDKQRAAEDANDMQMSTFKSHLPTPRPYLTSPWLLPPPGGLGIGIVGGGGIFQLDTAIPTCGWSYCEIL